MKKHNGMILLAVLVIGLFAWIAGADGPLIIESARDKAHRELTKLVDTTTLDVKRAEAARKNAIKEQAKLSGAKVKAEISLRNVRRDIRLAEEAIGSKRIELKEIQQYITEKIDIKTISGRVLTSGEVAVRVSGIDNAIKLSSEKLSFLRNIESKWLGRLNMLDINLKKAPTVLANLDISLNFLKDKVDYYRESYEMIMEEFDEDSQFQSFVRTAQDTLEKAHDHLDVKIAEVEQTFLFDHSEPLQLNKSAVGSENILSDIQRILNESGSYIE